MEKIIGVILAAGKGTRMGSGEGSEIPKVMYRIAEKPMIEYSVENVKSAGVEKVTLVVGYKKELVIEDMGDKVEYVVQEEQLGTGHAVMMAKESLEAKSEAILVCYGDMPLFKTDTIRGLIAMYEREKPMIAMLTVDFENPQGYGRIIRDENGDVLKNVEQKDCTQEQLKISECNPCFYVFNSEWLWDNLEKLRTENAQHEYYLTDLIEMARRQNVRVLAMKVSEESEAFGVNTQEQLKEAEGILALRAKIVVGS